MKKSVAGIKKSKTARQSGGKNGYQKLLEGFTVSRCVKPMAFGPLQSAQLHHFADVSETVYGITTYLLLSNQTGEKCCTLLMGKVRVAPLKRVTIPRLELTAAVVAVKMDQMLRR